MKITRETVEEVIKEKLANGETVEEIENNFKDALKAKLINVDIYYMAMEKLYA